MNIDDNKNIKSPIDNLEDISYNFGKNDNNLKILYITFSIIIGILLLWIIIVVFTKEDSFKVLSEMNNLTTQIFPVSDNKLTPVISELEKLPISNQNTNENNWPTNDTIIVPEGYVNTPDISTNDITSLPI